MKFTEHKQQVSEFPGYVICRNALLWCKIGPKIERLEARIYIDIAIRNTSIGKLLPDPGSRILYR